MLVHNELDSLPNGIDWDQPLPPLDLNLPTDPDKITLLQSSSSPMSPVVLSDEPPNPLVDIFLQSLTDNPIQITDKPTVPQQESRAKYLLPSLFDSKAQPNITQSEESQSTPSSPRGQSSNLTALRALTQTPKPLSHDQIVFKTISKFLHRNRERVTFNVANLFEGPNLTPVYITN